VSETRVPRQDVLRFEGLFGREKYEAVPAGEADAVVARHRRRARKLVAYRVLAVVLVCAAGTAVLFRFVRDVQVAGGVGLVAVVVGSALQLRARDQGVPEVVARDVKPSAARREYGVEPAIDAPE